MTASYAHRAGRTYQFMQDRDGFWIADDEGRPINPRRSQRYSTLVVAMNALDRLVADTAAEPTPPTRQRAYDERCEELAEHFLDNATIENPDKLIKAAGSVPALAQAIQDAVEAWFAAQPDYDGPDDPYHLIGWEGGVRYGK